MQKNLKEESCSEEKCHAQAKCHTYGNGESCCRCHNDYSGNGLYCYEKSSSIIVRGKLKGKINDVDLVDQDLHGYVHTLAEDTRNYVAFGPLPVEIGSRASLLATLVTPIHWLFAGDTQNNALNGFELTGGVFTRQSESTFLDEQGNTIGSLYINQNFTGFQDNANELNIDTEIAASLPSFASSLEQVIYPDFNQEFLYRSNLENGNLKKVIDSKGSIYYKLTSLQDPSSFKNFRIEYTDVIHFSIACQSLNDEKLAQRSASTKLSTKKIFVTFENEKFARFTSANYIRSLDDPTPNPCDDSAPNECSVYAECVVDAGSDEGYYCQCKAGFDGDGKQCQDINECSEGQNFCSPNAKCTNLLGYFDCKCLPPLDGDGRTCEMPGQEYQESNLNNNQNNQNSNNNNDDDSSKIICERCNSNAYCKYDEERYQSYCVCNEGYYGNGFQCLRDSQYFTTTTESITTSTEPRNNRKHNFYFSQNIYLIASQISYITLVE